MAVGVVERLSEFCEVISELGDAVEEFDSRVRDGLGVFGLLMLLPREVDRGEEADEGCWGGEQDSFFGSVEDEIIVPFQRCAEKRLCWEEEDHFFEGGDSVAGEVGGVVFFGERLDGAAQFFGVIADEFGSVGGVVGGECCIELGNF